MAAKGNVVVHEASIEHVPAEGLAMAGWIVVCSCGWRGERRAYDLSDATLGFSDHLAVGDD
jgi:hypothetical protein